MSGSKNDCSKWEWGGLRMNPGVWPIYVIEQQGTWIILPHSWHGSNLVGNVGDDTAGIGLTE